MNETNGNEKISPELLALIHSLGAKQQIAKASYEAVIQEVSQQYKLAQGDNVDLATGIITRVEKKESAG